MNVRSKRALLAYAAGLLFAGCATQEYGSLRPDRSNWLKADDEAAALAVEAEEPDIRPRTHFAAGQLLEQRGNIHQAVMQYRRAIVQEPDYVPAYNRLGVLLGRLGQHAEAEDALVKAVEMRPKWGFLRNNLGFEYLLQERWKDAEEQLREAVRLRPDFRRAHNNLAMVLFKMGRVEESLNAFKKAVPEADAYYNLGLMFRGEDYYEEAADAFERVLALAPNFQAANIQLAEIAPHLESEFTGVATADMDDWEAGDPADDEDVAFETDLPPAETLASGPEHRTAQTERPAIEEEEDTFYQVSDPAEKPETAGFPTQEAEPIELPIETFDELDAAPVVPAVTNQQLDVDATTEESSVLSTEDLFPVQNMVELSSDGEADEEPEPVDYDSDDFEELEPTPVPPTDEQERVE